MTRPFWSQFVTLPNTILTTPRNDAPFGRERFVGRFDTNRLRVAQPCIDLATEGSVILREAKNLS